MRRVGRVGVWPGVDGGPGGGQVLPPPALGEQAQDGQDDHQDEDEAGHGDGDGEVALREADLRGVVHARDLLLGRVVGEAAAVEVEVGGLLHVEAGVDLDGDVLAVVVVERAAGLVLLDRLPLPPPLEGINALGVAGGRDVVTASRVLDAQSDVALVVDGRGVRELVRLEVHQRRRFARRVLELAHDLPVHGTPAKKDKKLIN